MDLQLNGKRALVTGSNSGIGEAIATTLAREGASVVVHGRNQERVDRVVGEIRSADGEALGVTADLADDAAAERLADEASAAFGGVDILVNNAGGGPPRNLDGAKPGDFLDMYNANVVSAVRVIRPLVGDMRQAGWGRVIQISSALASQPAPFMVDYAAAKAALLNLTIALAAELSHTAVTVNTVSPGIIRTPPIEQGFRAQAEQQGWGSDWPEIEAAILGNVVPNQPTGRLGVVTDVADLVAFLVSPRADYVNGANFRVDGGMVLGLG